MHLNFQERNAIFQYFCILHSFIYMQRNIPIFMNEFDRKIINIGFTLENCFCPWTIIIYRRMTVVNSEFIDFSDENTFSSLKSRSYSKIASSWDTHQQWITIIYVNPKNSLLTVFANQLQDFNRNLTLSE